MRPELNQFSEKMDKAIAFYTNDINTIRAGRANPAVLDKVQVEYYGVPSPLNQVGTVSVPEPTMIVIQPWDATILGEIEKAINKADLGLTPQNDGKVIRLNFPPLTEERRKELAKGLSKKTEDAKVNIRGVRRDAMDFFKKAQKNSEITEDDLKSLEDEIQKLTDAKIKELEGIGAAKEKDIMSI
ncbi:MAG: ribosome recycling factor [Clostridia bacterium]|nr:ribosome recycling factor [Clostridia bacterium]